LIMSTLIEIEQNRVRFHSIPVVCASKTHKYLVILVITLEFQRRTQNSGGIVVKAGFRCQKVL
ncbi:hypothetical protein HMI55_005021, partial [Coelomomyces lativittatus]